jgi:hypothetical protein
MSSANGNILPVSLPICIPFISSSCIIALARNYRVTGESRHPCLIPEFRENGFSLFPFSMMLAIYLSYIAFVTLRHILSIPSFLRAFIMKWC